MKIKIHQIYYSDETRKLLLPGFIPLDNSSNKRPDWFEFWVILNFLRENSLDDDTWYGFLSPKFYEKTGFDSRFVLEILEKYGENANVALFSPGWDQLSYFLNPFEQGEVCHPGLLPLSQKFFDAVNLKTDLKNLVSDTTSSVFSNYIIARKEFWQEWKRIAEAFFEYAENNTEFKTHVSYRSVQNQYPMKTFIQERFASLILSTGSFKVLTPDQSLTGQIFTRLFPNDIKTRRLLQSCDLMKSKFRETSDKKFLDMYWALRKDIKYSNIKF
jgi:hypothetical protein